MHRRDFLYMSTLGGLALVSPGLIIPSARAASTAHALGTTAPSFTAQEILLYQLQVTVATWSCAYASSSGSYTRYSSISSLISDLQNGVLGAPDGSLPSFESGDECPDILVREPCYVVIVVSGADDSTLAFQSRPLTMAQSLGSRYCGLTEPYADSDGAYRVCYFAVPNPPVGADDPYSMYLQYGSSPTLHSIDPAIKNRGIQP